MVRGRTLVTCALILIFIPLWIGYADEPFDEVGIQDPTATSTAPSSFPSSKPTSGSPSVTPLPNLLFMVSDQLRWDVLDFVQQQLGRYSGKLKVNTPNIHRLATMGVMFDTAYCESPSCAPSRASFMTGNTVKRTGLTSNSMLKVYGKMKIFRDRVQRLQTFEQLLAASLGYKVESYGKWHMPSTLFMDLEQRTHIVSYDCYDYETDNFTFIGEPYILPCYRQNLPYLLDRDHVATRTGPQRGPWSRLGYDAIHLDYHFVKGAEAAGRDSLGPNYTTTALVGDIALKALDRLGASKEPFVLSVQFNSPHPPYIATGDFMDKYSNMRDLLFISPSIKDPMPFSAYNETSERNFPSSGFNVPAYIAELVAIYYGLVEEVDSWIGKLIDRLEDMGLTNNTLVIFTSDHGDLLGAHAMTGKGVLLEEAVRVPLILKLPQGRNAGTQVSIPVSQLDLFSTILDYLGAPESIDKSDGTSLRRFIDQTSFNANYDEAVVVSELDNRVPVSATALSGKLGGIPNYMVRKGNFKLIVPSAATSPVMDMLYDLSQDPYEMKNLLASPSNAVIGKAEHLKILLIEWMARHDGSEGYFSDPKFNNNEGRGDMTEVNLRRSWKKLAIWLSDSAIVFAPPAQTAQGFIRNEYLYLGRSISGTLQINSIIVKGPSKQVFSVSTRTATITQGGYRRLKITFQSMQPVTQNSISAYLLIRTSEGKRIVNLSL